MINKKNLLIKVLVIGALIAVLSYLFHPDAEQFSLMYNGEPVADPLIRFAAFPTFLIVIALTCLLAFMLFFGFGVLIFLGGLLMALLITWMIAPYFWPIIVLIGIMLALSDSPNHPNDHEDFASPRKMKDTVREVEV